MRWFGEFLVRYPELALFLSLGIGHWIGRFKYKGFGLGPVTGSLLAGVLIGQFGDIPVSGMAKSILFLLFLFGIGYSCGPQFFSSMRGGGLRIVALGVFVPCVGLMTAYAVARILGLDAGFAAGLTSGALTESAAIGTAAEAINSLPLPEAQRARLIGHIAVADSICYLFGAFGVIWFCGDIGPKLLRVDLKAEARKLEETMGMARAKPGQVSAWRQFELRAYRVREAGAAVGATIAEIEAKLPGKRYFILRIRRDGNVAEAEPGMVLKPGDVVAVAGAREVLVETIGRVAQEIEDRELLDIPATVYEVLLADKRFVGRTLADIAANDDEARGVFLRRIMRGGESIPVAPGTVIERGDVLSIVGTEAAVERVAHALGTVIRPVDVPDYITLGIAIFIGGLVGAVVGVPIGGHYITLSTSVGALLAGLVVGWMRTHFPLLGRIPDHAVSMMISLGLAAFVAMVGLHAGPIFLHALREAGAGLLLGGMAVTMVPLFAGLYFGRYVLRINPILLLGALAGAQTMTPGLASVQEKSGSPVAVLGYTAAVPFGHVLLTTWGTVIVILIGG